MGETIGHKFQLAQCGSPYTGLTPWVRDFRLSLKVKYNPAWRITLKQHNATQPNNEIGKKIDIQ